MIPGWEKPILKATMQVRSALGVFKNADEAKLAMTQNSGDKAPSGFVLLIDGQVRKFKIQTRVPDTNCNSVDYVAVAVDPVDAEGKAAMTLQLTDHTNRICKDVREHDWEATVKKFDKITEAELGSAELAGNPHTVISIQ